MSRSHGFTLIELIVVVAIVAILATFAYSTYTEQMRKSRRAQAVQILSDLSLRQERWRGFNSTYGTITNIGGDPLIAVANSPFYTITASNLTAVRYTLTAAPRSGTAQADDRCGSYVFDMQNGTVSKTAASGQTNCY